MNKIFFFLFTLCFNIPGIFGQSISDYNIRGDQAMKKEDFFEARMWYTEGLVNCDQYSIRKLTDIWISKPEMQSSMLHIMKKCYVCLGDKADTKDSNAMLLLSEYYKLGIAVEKDSIKADFWLKEVAVILGISSSPTENTVLVEEPVDSVLVHPVTVAPQSPWRNRDFRIFLTYVFSPTMPVGFSIGGYNKFGGYFSFKSSINKPSATYDCNNNDIINYTQPGYFDKEKWHSMMFTAGALFPVYNNLFLSLGGGYAKRDLYNHFAMINNTTGEPEGSVWCYNTESSYKGFVIELGGLYQLKKFILNAGINSTSFKDFDGYVGLGYSF